MMSALECYREAKECAHEATKASGYTDRSMLTAKALRWIIVARTIEARKPRKWPPPPTSGRKTSGHSGAEVKGGKMMSVLERYQKAREFTDDAAKASLVTDRSMLRAGVLRSIIWGKEKSS